MTRKPSRPRVSMKDALGLFGVILVLYLTVHEAGRQLALDILHYNPILFYTILVPFIITSMGVWVWHRVGWGDR